MSRSRELWLEQREFLRRSGFSLRTLQRMVREKEVKIRLEGKRSRNGRHVMQYAASDLPPGAQMLLMQERIARSHIPETQMSVRPHPETHADRQISLFISPPPIPEDVRIALSSEQNEVAQQRLEVISPMLEFLNKSNGYKPVVHLEDGRDLLTLGEVAKYVSEQRNISERSVWRWYSRFKQHGFPALADDIRADKGTSRIFQQAPAAAQFAQAKYLGERLSVRRVHEALLRDWRTITPSAEIEAPSYETLRNFLNALPSPVTIMAREGETQFNERCAPYILVDYASMQPNDEWVCDHAKHDVWLLNDCLSGATRYVPIRPYVTSIIDMRTRTCLASVWSINPSSNTISTALRQAILKFGLPKTFYVDNGKDFLSVAGTPLGKIGLSPECSGVLAQLGIAARHCLPRHPQSKNIERFFGTMHSRFDQLWGDFYCGTSPDTRPESCDNALKEHTQLVKAGRLHDSQMKPVSAFIALCKDWMDNEYNLAPHSGRGMKNDRTGECFAPIELFNELLPEQKRRRLEQTNSPAALNALFWKVERRKVSEGACVTIEGRRYEPADAESYGKLFAEVERDILIACDPHDMGEALALDLDRHLIGRMRCQELVARGPVAKADIQEGMRKQRRARRVVKDYIENISRGHMSELQHIGRKAGVNMPALPEVMPPLRKVVGGSFHDEDVARQYLELGKE